jgi:cell volume regulation protein A
MWKSVTGTPDRVEAEVAMTIDQLDKIVLISAAVTFLAILAVRISSRAGLPSLLIYLLMGVALGESGAGINFDDAQLTHSLGFMALAVILAEGGLTTNWQHARGSLPIGLSLATIGVSISVGIVAVGAHVIFGMSWELAVLLGAVTSPTDAAAVFSVLRVVPLPRRITGALEAESGLNDAPTVVLVTLVSAGGHYNLAQGVGIVLGQLVLGLTMGLLVGFAGAWVLRRAALPASGLYPLGILTLAFLAYGAAAVLHGSGFAAIYVAALILGNADLPHRGATKSFAEGLAWLAQIGLFVMLGLLLSPGRITLSTVGLAIAAGALLTLVARPVSVAIASLVQPMPWNHLAFVSWAGLRGAVPVVLTTIPLAEGVKDSQRLFDLVFVMVVIMTAITGPTLPWVARLLRVAMPDGPRGLEVEVAPLERVAADLMQVEIGAGSRMSGVEVGELRLPPASSISLVIRGQQTMGPKGRTVLKTGDILLVVTPRHERDQVVSRLEEVAEFGRLATWLGPRRAPRRAS